MFDLNKLQEKSQEAAEKFAYLVSFKNTLGFNGKSTRLSLPIRYARHIASFGSNTKIKFNEDSITLSFMHKPTENVFDVISFFSGEAKANKKFFNRFIKSRDIIKLQFLPKTDYDGSLVSWHNVKLQKVNTCFTDVKDENMMETTLTFSFDKTKYEYSSATSYKVKEKTKKSVQIYNDFIKYQTDNALIEAKFEQQRDLMDKELGYKPITLNFEEALKMMGEVDEHVLDEKVHKANISKESNDQTAE